MLIPVIHVISTGVRSDIWTRETEQRQKTQPPVPTGCPFKLVATIVSYLTCRRHHQRRPTLKHCHLVVKSRKSRHAGKAVDISVIFVSLPASSETLVGRTPQHLQSTQIRECCLLIDFDVGLSFGVCKTQSSR